MTAATTGRGDPDPYANYSWLRENAPVSELYVPGQERTTWLVTTYDLARASLNDPRLSNDDRHATGEAGAFGSEGYDPARGLLDLDRPEHGRLRGLVSGAFSPGAVERMRPMMRRVSEEAVERIAGLEGCDLVAAYTLPAPVAIIHEVLGIPESEREDPARCFDLFYRTGMRQPIDTAALAELLAYVRHLVGFKRANPGEDVGTHLVRGLETGDLHSEDELVSMVLSVLGAGHVTTVQFLGAAVVRLLEEPAVLAAVRAGDVTWTAVVDEVLRLDSPVQASVYRYVTEDMDLGGVPVSRGDAVLVSIASANRDPARFSCPDAFRPDRGARSGLAFGFGAHLCLGANLARLEGEIALDVLFQRLDSLTAAIPLEDVTWSFGPMLRGPLTLPVIHADPEQNRRSSLG